MGSLSDYLAFQRWTASEIGRVAFGWTVSIAALLPIPILVKKLFDDAIPDGDLRLLFAIGLGLSVLQLVSFGGTLLARPVAIRKAWSTGARIRDRIVTSIYRRSLTSLRSRSTSDLHDLLVHETERVDILGVALTTLIIPPIFLGSALILLLLAINWWLCLVLLLVTPMLYYASRAMSHRVWLRTVAHNEAYRSVSQESLRLVESVELAHTRAAVDLEQDSGRDRHRLLAAVGSEMRVLSHIHPDVLQTLLAVTVSATLVIGGAAVIREAISLGDLFAFYAGLALLRQPISRLSGGLPTIAGGRESLDRINKFLSEEGPPVYLGTREHTIVTRVALDGVSFGYGSKVVLDEVSLDLTRGTLTLLVGPNASGKSTIFNLLLGLYRPAQGHVTADDRPYTDLDLTFLRRQIGAVFQSPYLLDGTVEDNLRYGRHRASADDLERAAEISTADTVISSLSDGMATHVGGTGVILSGGQRQRIAIARALVGDPSVLLLDEPTNHLDRTSLNRVLENIVAMDNAPAILLISHDDRVVELADSVIELVDGRVVSATALERDRSA